ncbi:hypothetical protein Dimus_009358 [Dionaea muscipula]
MFTAMVGGGSFLGGVIDDVNERTCVKCKRVYKTVKAMHGHLWIHRERNRRRGSGPGPKSPIGEASGGEPIGPEDLEPEDMEEEEEEEEDGPGADQVRGLALAQSNQQEEEPVGKKGIDFDLNHSPPTDDDIGFDDDDDDDDNDMEGDDDMEADRPYDPAI